MDTMNMASVAWVMASTALVMVMLPGLSLFYSGLVRGKNALATAMHCFSCLGIVLIVWVLWGYSLAFGPSVGGIIGNLDHIASQRRRDGFAPRPGDPGTAVHALSGHVRRDHTGAAGGRHGRTCEVPCLWRFCRALGHFRLLPDRPLGLGWRLAA